MFDTKAFHALEGSYNASWLQQKTISANLANLETPNYKTKSINFEDTLADSMNGAASGTSGDYSFSTTASTDETSANRLDGNNVDSEEQSLKLYKAYAQYSYLTSKINSQFSNMRYVVTNAFK